jgi:hypothetical protein
LSALAFSAITTVVSFFVGLIVGLFISLLV